MQSNFVRIDGHLAMALLTHAKGRARETAFHLKTAFRIAGEKQCRRFYLVSKQDLAKACLLCLELDIRESLPYVTDLLETELAPIVKPELIALSRHSNRRIREGAMRLRERIHRAGLPRIRIETLGGFRVWRGKDLIEEGEWRAKQPKLLLKAIVGLGGSRVSRQLLVDHLWPDAAPAAGEKSFRSVLHHQSAVPRYHSETGRLP